MTREALEDTEDGEHYEMFDAVPTSSRKNASDEAAEKFDIENLYDLIGTLGSNNDISITIDKQGRNGKYEFVETYPASDVTTDTINMLRDELGSGNYRFRAKRKGDKHALWSNTYSFTKRLRIHDDQPRTQNSAPSVDLTPVLEQLRAQNELILKLFEQQTQNKMRPEDQEEVHLRKMIQYKQLFSDGGGGRGGDFDIFIKLLPIVKDLVAPDSGSNTTDLIRDVVKGMTEIVKKNPKQILPPRPQLQGQPQLQSNPPIQPVQPVDLKKKEHEAMLSYFQHLTDRAIAGDDPKELAELIVEKIDTDNLVNLLEEENLIEVIIAADVRAYDHRAWFESLIKELNTLIFEDDTDENEVESKPEEKK